MIKSIASKQKISYKQKLIPRLVLTLVFRGGNIDFFTVIIHIADF